MALDSIYPLKVNNEVLATANLYQLKNFRKKFDGNNGRSMKEVINDFRICTVYDETGTRLEALHFLTEKDLNWFLLHL